MGWPVVNVSFFHNRARFQKKEISFALPVNDLHGPRLGQWESPSKRGPSGSYDVRGKDLGAARISARRNFYNQWKIVLNEFLIKLQDLKEFFVQRT